MLAILDHRYDKQVLNPRTGIACGSTFMANENNDQDVQKLLQTLDGINAESFGNNRGKILAVLAAYALESRLETPWDFVARLCMGQVRKDSAKLTHKQLLVWICRTGQKS